MTISRSLADHPDYFLPRVHNYNTALIVGPDSLSVPSVVHEPARAESRPGLERTRLEAPLDSRTRTQRHCEDLDETLCPPDWAGIADMTRRVAAESSFALAKGNVRYTVFLGGTVN